MKQTVKVVAINEDATAQVLHIRQSACSGDCHKCSGCGAAQEALKLTARNPIGAQVGDMVNIEGDTGSVLLAATLLYILPLVLFFAGYILGHLLWDWGGRVGCLAFGLGILLAVTYDRLVLKKKETVYTITEFAPDMQANS